MSSQQYRTNLRCTACVAKIAPLFEGDDRVQHWSVDLASQDKTLSIDSDLSAAEVASRMLSAGYTAVALTPSGEFQALPVAQKAVATQEPELPAKSLATYWPLLLVVGYLLLVTVGFEGSQGNWETMRAMRHFMAGFFLVFSFFKLLDLRTFSEVFATYDVLAARWPVYGLCYPFLELGLGLTYLLGVFPVATNLGTMTLMGLGLIGISEALFSRRTVRCACLGTGFNLPMSTVTLIENSSMLLMAAAMLWLVA